MPAEKSNAYASVKEFIVEFFGAMLPGVVFVVAAIVALAWPAYMLTHGLSMAQIGAGTGIAWDHSLLISFVNAYEWPVSLVGLCICYVFGQIFLRQDPKVPDTASLAYLIDREEHRKRLDVKPKHRIHSLTRWTSWILRLISKGNTPDALSDERTETLYAEAFGCRGKQDCEWPYLGLGSYLRVRGLDHLSRWFVLWDPKDNPVKQASRNAEEQTDGGARPPSDQKNELELLRSKNHINVLKVRLAAEHPQYYTVIAKNEGHIRLMSSTWYAARTLIQVSLGAMGTVAVVLVLARLGHWTEPVSAAPIVPAGVIIGAAWWAERSVVYSLHYQRMREIVFVLESAYSAFRDKPSRLRVPFANFMMEEQELANGSKLGGGNGFSEEPECYVKPQCPVLHGSRPSRGL